MSLIQKIWKGGNNRKSRFHDEKNHFALATVGDLRDCSLSLGTGLLRVGFGVRLKRPWVAANAFRFLAPKVSPDFKVFEWGSGMSTLWFDTHCSETHAVEDDNAWASVVRTQVQRAQIYSIKGEAYVMKLNDFPNNYFDLISIDGSHRTECFKIARERIKLRGILLLDNTDKDQTTKGDLYQMDQLLKREHRFEISRFTGWAPGNFFAQETTVCIRTSL